MGLASEEAERRFAEAGPNTVVDWPEFSIIACIVAVSVGRDVVQEQRAELAAARLGGHYSHADDPPPPRPEWMRHATYERLWTVWEAQIERHDAIYKAGAARFRAVQ